MTQRIWLFIIYIAAHSLLFSYENKFSYVNEGNGSGKVSLNNFPNLIQREDGYTRIAKMGD